MGKKVLTSRLNWEDINTLRRYICRLAAIKNEEIIFDSIGSFYYEFIRSTDLSEFEIVTNENLNKMVHFKPFLLIYYDRFLLSTPKVFWF